MNLSPQSKQKKTANPMNTLPPPIPNQTNNCITFFQLFPLASYSCANNKGKSTIGYTLTCTQSPQMMYDTHLNCQLGCDDDILLLTICRHGWLPVAYPPKQQYQKPYIKARVILQQLPRTVNAMKRGLYAYILSAILAFLSAIFLELSLLLMMRYRKTIAMTSNPENMTFPIVSLMVQLNILMYAKRGVYLYVCLSYGLGQREASEQTLQSMSVKVKECQYMFQYVDRKRIRAILRRNPQRIVCFISLRIVIYIINMLITWK